MPHWTPTGEGPRFRALGDPGPAGAVPGHDHHSNRSERVVELQPRRWPHQLSHRHGREVARRYRSGGQHGYHRRGVDRPDARARVGQGDAARLPRTVPGRPAQRRHLRHSELRLYAHHLLAEPHTAAPDGESSPNRFRAAFSAIPERRIASRGSGACTSRRACWTRSTTSCGHWRASWVRRTSAAWSSTRRRCAMWNGGSR